MQRTAASILMAFLLGACGGESSSDGDGSGGAGTGGSTGGSSGTGGTGGSMGGASGAGGSMGGASGAGGSTGGTAGSGGSTGGAGGSTGGAGGSTGGAGGSTGGAGGGGPAKPECSSDADCKIFSDCCNCLGVPTSESPTGCPVTCIQDKCSELGAPTKASCVAGRCVTGFSCDSSKVTCKAATPVCNPGQVPLINSAGNCWQGGCVPAGECSTVKACGECTGDLVCASYQTQLGIQNHCVDVPKVCGSNFSCACLGPSVCTPPYATCADFSGQKGVSCSCPNC